MHFYATNKETGKVEPKHFVENKSKGGLRPSRVTDAKKAAKNEGIDWKAVSHAVRCAYQMKSVYEIGDIRFPLKESPTILYFGLPNLNLIALEMWGILSGRNPISLAQK